jgi:hypothetical protein
MRGSRARRSQGRAGVEGEDSAVVYLVVVNGGYIPANRAVSSGFLVSVLIVDAERQLEPWNTRKVPTISGQQDPALPQADAAGEAVSGWLPMAVRPGLKGSEGLRRGHISPFSPKVWRNSALDTGLSRHELS